MGNTRTRKNNNEVITMTQADLQALIAQEVAKALSGKQTKSAPKAKAKTQPKAKKVAFTKHDGTVTYGTQKQVDAWTAYANRTYVSPEERKERLAQWQTKREGYKPSKKLIEAIKKDRASVTRKVACEQYGFVGTKDDLKALKESICK